MSVLEGTSFILEFCVQLDRYKFIILFFDKWPCIFTLHWDLQIVQPVPPVGHQKREISPEVAGPKGPMGRQRDLQGAGLMKASTTEQGAGDWRCQLLHQAL